MTAPQWLYLSKLRNNTLKFDSNFSNTLNKNSTNNTYATDDSLAQSDKEERIIDWLESRGINDG